MAAQTQVQVVLEAKDNASKVLNKFGDTASQTARKFEADFKGAGLMATAFLGSLTALAAGAVKVASSFEQNRIAFETMLGSAELAKDMMTDLAKFTLETPFEMAQVTQGAKSLMAYGVSAEEIIPTFKTLGDIAAGVGMDKLPNLVLAFGQVKAATRLTGMELRQFTEAGVPLLDILSKQMGRTVADIKDMVSAGEVGFPDVQKALESLTGEGGKFNDLMLRQSKTMAGLVSNIKDKIVQSMSEIAGVSVETGEIREGSLFAVLKDGAEKLYQLIDVITPKLIAFFEWFSSNKPALVVTAGIIGGMLVAAFVALAGAAASALITLIPFIAVGAAISSIGYLIYKAWSTNFLGIQDRLKLLYEFFVVSWRFIKDSVDIVTSWFTNVALPLIQNFFTTIQNVILLFVAIWQLEWAIIKDVTTAIFNWFLGWAGPTIISFFDWIKTALIDWVEAWKTLFNSIKIHVEEVVGWFMTYVHPTIKRAFDLIAGIVKGLWEEFKDKFDSIKQKVEEVINFIKGLIDNFKPKISIGLDLPNVEEAWNNLRNRARNIGVPGFQTGGIVPGPIGAPVLATVHGGEHITPTGRGGGSMGGSGLSFNVQIGLYAGTEVEKRNIARDLYAALVQVAQSQNKSVKELMGA